MQVLDQKAELDEIGATALFVVHDEPKRVLAGVLGGLDVPFPVLVDLDREAYRAWGLGRSSASGIWLDPRVWRRYAAFLARGERPRRLGRDTLQLGGDFVVGPAGTITYSRPQRRDDRPYVLTLVDELRASAASERAQ